MSSKSFHPCTSTSVPNFVILGLVPRIASNRKTSPVTNLCPSAFSDPRLHGDDITRL